MDIWECDPGVYFESDPELDFAIVGVKKKDGIAVGEVFDYFDVRKLGRIEKKNHVNILGHPDGRKMEIAFRDNYAKAVKRTFIQYETDTQPGSSGSPVLDDSFKLVALHSQSVRHPVFVHHVYRNQGFQVSAILQKLGTRDFK